MELAGRRIAGDEARGKHMFVRLEGGWRMRAHLGMKGRWVRRHIAQRRPPGRTTYLCPVCQPDPVTLAGRTRTT